MKLIVLGDVHGRFQSIHDAYERERPDAILHVGDLARQARGERRLDIGDYPDRLPPVPFIWVLGNHENLKTYQTTGVPLGFFGTKTLDGVRVVGVGGIPGTKRQVHWRPNQVLEKLTDIPRCSLLLTHEACHSYVHTRTGRVMGSPELAQHCARLQPKWHFSGHYHHPHVAQVHGVTHFRLPYAWKGYAVIEGARAELRPFLDAKDPLEGRGA